MKRNKFTLFLLIFSILLSLTSCGCKHEWVEATCDSAKYCTLCKKTDGEPLEHDFENATCITPKTCVVCGKSQGEALGHDFLPPTYERPATCTRCNDIRGEKLTPVSDWGFNNLSEMGNALVEITAYKLSDSNNAHVVATGAMIKFENGYKLNWGFTVQSQKCVFGTANSPESYKIVNNDNMVLNSGWDEFEINERKTVNSREKFVVFVNKGGPWDLYKERWYIPYSLIDWERGAVHNTTSDTEKSYLLYLNS